MSSSPLCSADGDDDDIAAKPTSSSVDNSSGRCSPAALVVQIDDVDANMNSLPNDVQNIIQEVDFTFVPAHYHDMILATLTAWIIEQP
jgi:hypothetical protein